MKSFSSGEQEGGLCGLLQSVFSSFLYSSAWEQLKSASLCFLGPTSVRSTPPTPGPLHTRVERGWSQTTSWSLCQSLKNSPSTRSSMVPPKRVSQARIFLSHLLTKMNEVELTRNLFCRSPSSDQGVFVKPGNQHRRSLRPHQVNQSLVLLKSSK